MSVEEFDVEFQRDVVQRLARIETHVEGLSAHKTDTETRIRTLEKRQWLIGGAAIVLGPLLTKLGLHLPFPS